MDAPVTVGVKIELFAAYVEEHELDPYTSTMTAPGRLHPRPPAICIPGTVPAREHRRHVLDHIAGLLRPAPAVVLPRAKEEEEASSACAISLDNYDVDCDWDAMLLDGMADNTPCLAHHEAADPGARIQLPHEAWPTHWVVAACPALAASVLPPRDRVSVRMVPAKVTSPVLAFAQAEGGNTNNNAWVRQLTEPVTRLQQGVRAFGGERGRLTVHVGFRDGGGSDRDSDRDRDHDHDHDRLLALKKLATIIWLGEPRLARLHHPLRRGVTPEAQPLGVASRLAQRTRADVEAVLDRGEDADYLAWMAPVLSAHMPKPTPPPTPPHDEVRSQAAAIRQALQLMGRRRSDEDEDGAITQEKACQAAGVAHTQTLLHELYLLWRAPTLAALVRLLGAEGDEADSDSDSDDDSDSGCHDLDTSTRQHAHSPSLAYSFANLHPRASGRLHDHDHHPTTVEFRLAATTLDPPLVAAWADVAASLAHRAATSTCLDFQAAVAVLCRPDDPRDDGGSSDVAALLAWLRVQGGSLQALDAFVRRDFRAR